MKYHEQRRGYETDTRNCPPGQTNTSSEWKAWAKTQDDLRTLQRYLSDRLSIKESF